MRWEACGCRWWRTFPWWQQRPRCFLWAASLAHSGTAHTCKSLFSDSSVFSCRFALKVPENLPLVAAAPLLCAGITTYSPMKHFGLDKKGQKLAVVGLGGLGHMAVKFGKGEPLILSLAYHEVMN